MQHWRMLPCLVPRCTYSFFNHLGGQNGCFSCKIYHLCGLPYLGMAFAHVSAVPMRTLLDAADLVPDFLWSPLFLKPGGIFFANFSPIFPVHLDLRKFLMFLKVIFVMNERINSMFHEIFTFSQRNAGVWNFLHEWTRMHFCIYIFSLHFSFWGSMYSFLIVCKFHYFIVKSWEFECYH